jgi:hypothetical protein
VGPRLWGRSWTSLSRADYPNFGEARHRLSGFRHAGPSTKPGKPTSRQAIAELLRSDLTKAGVDFRKFAPLIDQSKAEQRERAASLIAEARKRSPAVLEDLRRSVTKLTERVENLRSAGFQNASTEYVFLDTATEISTFGIAPPVHTRTAPQANVVNFNYTDSYGAEGFGAFGSVEASFGFSWQNPGNTSVTLNVDGYIVLNGLFQVMLDGGFVVVGIESKLSVDAALFIHELWNQPPTSPFDQPAQRQNAVTLDLSNDFGIAAPGDIDGENLYRGFDLQYNQFLMPPRGMAMFEVACTMNTYLYGGQVQADFADPFFQLLCPGVLLAVNHPPPSSDPNP